MTTHFGNGDDELGRQLEDVLRTEADTVQPIGDGLEVIRQKIGRRRTRRMWVVPMAGVAGVAAVGTIAFAVFNGTDPNRLNLQPGQPTPATTTGTTTTTTPTPVPTSSPTGTSVPLGEDTTLAIWPWATAGDVMSRNSLAEMNPKLVARDFVTKFGGKLGSDVTAEDVVTDVDGSLRVSVSRKVDNGPTIEVAVVHLHRWSGGALSVTSVTAAQRGFTNLDSGATLQSGQEIRGLHHPEDQYTVTVYAARGNERLLGTGRSAAISDTEWSATVAYAIDPTGPVVDSGAVIATDGSLADGGLGAMIAVPVRIPSGGATKSPSPTPTPDNPGGLSGSTTTFVGISGGRVAVFGTASGALHGYLTDLQAGGGDSAPSISPERSWVYFLRGTGTCANEIARVPFPGGHESQVEVVKTPSPGYVFDTMSAGPNGSVTWIEKQCGKEFNLALGWLGAANGAAGRIAVNGGPPTFTGTPRLSPDATKIAVFYVSGMLHSIHVYDVATAKGIEDGSPRGCTATDGCEGIDVNWAPDGSLLVLTDPFTVVRDAPGSTSAVKLYKDSSPDGFTTLDVSKDGDALLLWNAHIGQGTYLFLDAKGAKTIPKTYQKYDGPGTW